MNEHNKKLSEEEKIKFNKEVIKDNQVVGKKIELTKNLMDVGLEFYKNPFYCRKEGCQKLTNMVRVVSFAPIEKALGKELSGSFVFVPLCKEHYDEAHAFLLSSLG